MQVDAPAEPLLLTSEFDRPVHHRVGEMTSARVRAMIVQLQIARDVDPSQRRCLAHGPQLSVPRLGPVILGRTPERIETQSRPSSHGPMLVERLDVRPQVAVGEDDVRRRSAQSGQLDVVSHLHVDSAVPSRSEEEGVPLFGEVTVAVVTDALLRSCSVLVVGKVDPLLGRVLGAPDSVGDFDRAHVRGENYHGVGPAGRVGLRLPSGTVVGILLGLEGFHRRCCRRHPDAAGFFLIPHARRRDHGCRRRWSHRLVLVALSAFVVLDLNLDLLGNGSSAAMLPGEKYQIPRIRLPRLAAARK
mmetsp:Transcript_8613/g.15798  ORF Transcript_8613/g.15798 Transcript_8613/m.15798 type:complete len:302 (+) Transcript_8613:608-1513(+)